MSLLIYLIGVIIIGSLLSYFGIKNDWFIDTDYYDVPNPLTVIPAFIGTLFWPFAIFLLPIGVAIYFGIKHRKT